jgi:hypothetical protein
MVPLPLPRRYSLDLAVLYSTFVVFQFVQRHAAKVVLTVRGSRQ